MKCFIISEREYGMEIGAALTMEEAVNLVNEYKREDKLDGIDSEDLYEIKEVNIEREALEEIWER